MSSFKSQIGCINLHLGFFHSFISLLLCHVSPDRGSLAICLELVASGLTAGRDLISSWFDKSRDHPLCFWLVSQIWERVSVVVYMSVFSSPDWEVTCKDPSLRK